MAPHDLIGDDRRRSRSSRAGVEFLVRRRMAERRRTLRLQPDERVLRAQRSRRDEDARRRDGETDAEINLAFDDNRYASLVFGQYDQNLAKLERRLGVIANANGNHVTIKGSPEACEHARRVLENLYGARASWASRSASATSTAPIQEGALQGTLFPDEPRPAARPSSRSARAGAAPVRARNAAQDLYLRALKRHELVFAEGPAGTGKTWLAVGYAVSCCEQGVVERLILSRPAVEAGERLGFLPGDMREKVDPYLRPIYDALHDFMDAAHGRARHADRHDRGGAARLHARAHAHATPASCSTRRRTPRSMQMKMFLTRLGEGSRMIVTGDPRRPTCRPARSPASAEAIGLLSGLEGIGHVEFTEGDVVRHDLVRKIVGAYERAARERNPRGD